LTVGAPDPIGYDDVESPALRRRIGGEPWGCAVAPVDGRILFRALLAGVLIGTLGLTGCGRRGPLEAPPGAAAQTGGTGAATDPGIAKPDRPFVLDPLL
jgi:predicted small lipoprotein YifL